MGTFHHATHELHGITVVVDTTGPELWIGRCHDVTAEAVLLEDAVLHTEAGGDAASAVSKEAFVRKAADIGYWKSHPRARIEVARVASIRRLGEIG